MGQFDPKRTQPHNSTTALRIFFQTFYNESGQQVHENYINYIVVWDKKVIFGPKIMNCNKSRYALGFA